MTRYSWLILDADGTLLNFRHAEAVALDKTPIQMGLQVPVDFHATYHAINDSLWREFESGGLLAHQVRNQRFMRVFESLGISGDANAFSDAFLNNIIQESTFIDGAESLLRRLKNHIGLVLLTNGFADVQHARIARLGLGDMFGHVIISEEVGVAKPDPSIFEIAFEKMGRPRQADVLIIGDSLSSDIRGGADYGIDTCWFNPDQLTNMTNIKPTYQIRRLHEITKLIGLSQANNNA